MVPRKDLCDEFIFLRRVQDERKSEPGVHREGEHLSTENILALEYIWHFEAQRGVQYSSNCHLFLFQASLYILWSL